jgi:hypothetical protein
MKQEEFLTERDIESQGFVMHPNSGIFHKGEGDDGLTIFGQGAIINKTYRFCIYCGGMTCVFEGLIHNKIELIQTLKQLNLS